MYKFIKLMNVTITFDLTSHQYNLCPNLNNYIFFPPFNLKASAKS